MPSPPSGPNHGRVAILGGAAVGGFVAARRAQAGHQGVLIDAGRPRIDPANLESIQAR